MFRFRRYLYGVESYQKRKTGFRKATFMCNASIAIMNRFRDFYIFIYFSSSISADGKFTQKNKRISPVVVPSITN